MLSRTWPNRSTNGSLTGITSSLFATRRVTGTVPDHSVQVGQTVEFVHRRGVRLNRQEIITQLRLDLGSLRESEEAPCHGRTRGVMPGGEESVQPREPHSYDPFSALCITYVGTSAEKRDEYQAGCGYKERIRTGQHILIREPLAVRNIRCNVRLQEQRQEVLDGSWVTSRVHSEGLPRLR